MGLQWYGNPAWHDDREPETQVEVTCKSCKRELIWSRPLSYEGKPPKCKCGGTVERRTLGESCE
jgi:hypothetical protein